MDWLQLVVQGGALVVLAAVLFWVFRASEQTNKRLLDMIDAQLDQIRASTQVQQKLCDQIEHHEARAGDRHREVMGAVKQRVGSS